MGASPGPSATVFPIELPIGTAARARSPEPDRSLIAKDVGTRCHQAGSSVERKQPERLTACASEHPEVTLVGAQELQRSVTVRQNDDRRVRQSNAKVGVPLHDSLSVAYILGREQFELIGATRDLVDERHLRLVTNSAGNQIVQFCEHKG